MSKHSRGMSLWTCAHCPCSSHVLSAMAASGFDYDGAEILERRYPVVLQEFSLRPGSGGPGKFKGGDGVVREVGDHHWICNMQSWT